MPESPHLQRPLYYGLEGEPIDFERWRELMSLKLTAAQRSGGWSQLKDDPTRIGWTRVGELVVSTVWIGINHGFGGGPPLMFETMVFDPEGDEQGCWRYSTPEAARVGHDQVVADLRSHGA